VSKAKSAKDLLERMKTVAARRGTAPREADAAPPPAEPAEPAVKKKVRITVDLDPEMHRFLKVYAAERGMKVSEVMRKLISSLKTQERE
ncbi:MAG: hypothetical protein GXO35_02455, partial [Gammaproteobacteria bacterium]|nr:hypothetical protein [Gammaproteobacteria bacterium]